jgi:hypothetical protein
LPILRSNYSHESRSRLTLFLLHSQSWDEIGRTIEGTSPHFTNPTTVCQHKTDTFFYSSQDEKRNGNPVARLVKKLDLANNSVTVGLVNHLDTVEEGDGEDEEKDEEEKDGETDVAEASASASASKEEGGSKTPKKKRGKKHSLAVTLDLSLSAYANAREHHARRKKHEVKLTKTVNQNERALLASKAQGDGKKKQVRIWATPNPADCLQPLFECTSRNIYWQLFTYIQHK